VSGDADFFSGEEKDKLPKWALRKVQWLERRVRDAERRAEEARLPTQEDANTFLFPYDDIPIGLCNSDPIRFQLDPTANPRSYRQCIDISVRQHLSYGNCIQVSGSDSLLVIPYASNVFYIKHTRD
jgi:hypothetical protein